MNRKISQSIIFFLFFVFLNHTLCLAQMMNDRFKVYVCPETLSQGCNYQIHWTEAGERKFHAAVKFKNYSLIDPSGREFQKICLALKFGRTQLIDWLKINPNQNCDNNITKIYFLDYGYFFIGDFEVYHADGSLKEQLRLVKETLLIREKKKNTFKSSIRDIGIIKSLGDIKNTEEVKSIWSR